MDGSEGMKILICDDLPENEDEFEAAIRAVKPETFIKRLHRKNLPQELNLLFENVENVLNAPDEPVLRETEFDRDYDLVFIDNNLAYLNIEGARFTAEAVAGYIRAFSSSRYLVSLNKNPDVDFDLRYLMGDYETKADLALNTKHLSNRGLWTHKREDAAKGFLPSYWPCLNEVGEKRRQQIEFIRERLNGSVLQSLDFDDNAIDFLSRHATGTLFQSSGTEISDLREATFMDVFSASKRFLPIQEERNKLRETAEQGFDGAKQIVARVVAATFDYWFRRDILGPQDVLVDIAHLLPRMPFLLGTAAADIDRWNDALESDDPLAVLDPDLAERHLQAAIFSHNIWISSPCFWWNEIRENDDLNSLFFEDDINWASAVFCEDRSEFVPRPEEDQPRPFEFVTEFEAGPWNRRFVHCIEDFSYAPKSRFAA